MAVKDRVRTIAWRVFPERMADRARDHERGWRRQTGATEIARQLIAAHGPAVLDGPCAGLTLLVDRVDEIDQAAAKLIGTYEREIHPALDLALGTKPSRFVDVGSADGYFAAGLGRAAGIPVHAFDLSPGARDLTLATARLNDVDLTTHRAATPATVGALDLDRALLLCDIEGGEHDLFTPDLCARLGTAHVVVELHELPHPDIADHLRAALGATHHVTTVQVGSREPADHPALQALPDPAARELVVNEQRWRFDGFRWLIATPA